jgi:hypothetical protein
LERSLAINIEISVDRCPDDLPGLLFDGRLDRPWREPTSAPYQSAAKIPVASLKIPEQGLFRGKTQQQMIGRRHQQQKNPCPEDKPEHRPGGGFFGLFFHLIASAWEHWQGTGTMRALHLALFA